MYITLEGICITNIPFLERSSLNLISSPFINEFFVENVTSDIDALMR